MAEDDRQSPGRACPVCGRPAVAGPGPFCSKRCADIDLGRWLKGLYRVPANEPSSEDESGGEDGA